MTGSDGRVPLSPQPDDPEDWTYLQAVVEAERAWGNRAEHELRDTGPVTQLLQRLSTAARGHR